MTLQRLNRTDPVSVIDRTDDSAGAQTRVAVYGRPGFFLEVLIEAILRCGFTAWRADWPGDEPIPDSADLVVLSLGADGYSQRIRRLIRRIAGQDLIAVTIDAAAPRRHSRRWTPAGAIWAVDPASTSMEELADTIIAAAEQRRMVVARRDRANRAAAVWNAARESSILMMRQDRGQVDDGTGPDGVSSPGDGDRTGAGGGDDGGRQQW
jgi:hypothetical protein